MYDCFCFYVFAYVFVFPSTVPQNCQPEIQGKDVLENKGGPSLSYLKDENINILYEFRFLSTQVIIFLLLSCLFSPVTVTFFFFFCSAEILKEM